MQRTHEAASAKNLTALAALTALLPGSLGACSHWQSHGVPQVQGAADVKLVESGPVPSRCRSLGPVSAQRGALQKDDTLDTELRNAAAKLHGNLVMVTRRSALSAQGEAHHCSDAPAPSPAAPNMLKVAHRDAPPLPPASSLDESSLDDRARELFVLGRDAYLRERYEEALRYFNAAFELSGRYELHYNIGQSADRLHRNADALAAFERFLQSAPPSQLRSETEARVATLRAE
jgi:tetratricopeptide (TPR) repeat protein